MMLFTVIPLDDVLEGMEEAPVPTVVMSIGGVTLELEPGENFQAKVVRVISTDPSHYLNSSYKPGSIVHWT